MLQEVQVNVHVLRVIVRTIKLIVNNVNGNAHNVLQVQMFVLNAEAIVRISQPVRVRWVIMIKVVHTRHVPNVIFNVVRANRILQTVLLVR